MLPFCAPADILICRAFGRAAELRKVDALQALYLGLFVVGFFAAVTLGALAISNPFPVALLLAVVLFVLEFKRLGEEEEG